MELRDYQCFERLAAVLHFGQAARELGLSASALTRRVQAMEEELGLTLLLRDQRHVELTAAGQRFLAFARSQINQWEQLVNELRESQDAPSGQLDIACTVTACHSVLPKLLAEYRRRYPKVTLRLITQDAERSLGQLERGEVDVAVIPTESGDHQEVERIALGHTALRLIAPAEAGPLAAALECSPPAWQRLPFVAQVGGLERQHLLGWLRGQGIQPRIVAEVRGNEGIIAMVSLGSGLALVPELVLNSSPLRDRVRRLPHGPETSYAVSLCARPRGLKRTVVRLLWELAQAHPRSSAL